MFAEMVASICDDMVKYLFAVTIVTNAERRQVIQVGSSVGSKDEVRSAADEEKARRNPRPGVANSGAKAQPVRVAKRPGRNDPCPCGSGKKYKNCCMLKEEGQGEDA